DRRRRGMHGWPGVRLLHESPRPRHTSIVFLSCADTGEDRLAVLLGGGVDYVSKRFLPAEVVARIRIHLQRTSHDDRTASDDPMPLLSDGEIILRAAMRLIHAHLADVPPLTEVARQVGTHDKTLSAIFRQYLGMTVFAWVREERLRVSREWLADSNMSVGDIAAEVGFRSAANFATAFRQRMDVTPRQYRASLREADTPGNAGGR